MLRGIFDFQDFELGKEGHSRTSDTQYVETVCPMTYAEGIILDTWQGSEDRSQAEPEHRPAEHLQNTNRISYMFLVMFRHTRRREIRAI
jgi:hypothetical protein